MHRPRCAKPFAFPATLAFILAVLFGGPGALPAAPPSGPSGPNVVLIHGFWNTGSLFDPLVAILEKQGCRCFAPSLRPNDFRDGIRAETLRLRTAVEGRFGKDAPVVFVCFSMGGLAARDYVENLGGARRTRAMFFISTGHLGSRWASFSPERGKRELAPGSAVIRQLNARVGAMKGIPIRSYWTPYDLVVIPASNTRWPFDERLSQRVPCVFHPWMPHDRRVMADIAARIAGLPAGR